LCITNSYEANLTITSNDERLIKEEHENRKIKNINEIIESKPSKDETLRFNILIKEANKNKINEYFKSKAVVNIKLDIKFENLDKENAKQKLSTIKAKYVNIDIVQKKQNLLKLINENVEIKSATLCLNENKLYEKVNRYKLINRLNQFEDNATCYVNFTDLKFDTAIKIIQICCETLCFIRFVDIYDYYGSELNDGRVNFYFRNLNNNNSKWIIKLLRKENFELNFEFSNLTSNQVQYIIANAKIEQDEIEIKKFKI
jgi:hypothetical protein